MRGFNRFVWETRGWSIDAMQSTTHRISRSPLHAQAHAALDLDACLAEFLDLDDVYRRYVPLIDGAFDSVHELGTRHEVAFVTATLWESPMSFGSKLMWLDDHFPGVPMISVGAEHKHWVAGDFAIDDRHDTCVRWTSAGVKTFLFRQPWNEAPPGTPTYEWKEITDELIQA